MTDAHETLALLRLKGLAIGALLLLHLTLSYTWIPSLFGIWPVAVGAPSMNLTGFAAFLNLFGLVLFFILSGFLLRPKAVGNPRYFLQKARQNTLRFIRYYLLLSALFFVLLVLSKGRLLQRSELSFLSSFYHLWFLLALALFQFSSWLIQQCFAKQLLHFKIPLAIPVFVHAVGLYLQGGIFLKTPTQIAPDTLLTILVYFTWFFYGLSTSTFSDWVVFQKVKSWYFPLLILAFYFLVKAALIFSWTNTPYLRVLGAIADPFAFLAALKWWFQIEKKHLKASIDTVRMTNWQLLLQRHQLTIYVFQIPVIFVWIALLEKCGAPVQNEFYSAGMKPNWHESLTTWVLYNLTLLVFGLGAWWWWKQKTPHSENKGF